MKKIKKEIKGKNKIKVTNQIAICLLSFQPKLELIELYDGLYQGDSYQIYVIVDDNEWDISDLKENFSNIVFIKVKEEICKKMGYQNLNYMVKNGEPSAWDKGIYYFCEESKIQYPFIWFLEEDVFIPTSNTIKNIDEKYDQEDLLIKSMNIPGKNVNRVGPQLNEVDKYINPKLKLFLRKSMVCAIRISHLFIQKIKEYVRENKTLFFLEYFFPTIAEYLKLKVNKIEELEEIHFRKIWTIDDIFKRSQSLFHPVKDVMLQKSFRRTIDVNDVYFLLKRVFKNRLLDNKDVKLKNMYLLQTAIYKNEEGNIIKLYVNSSIEETKIYLEVDKRYKKNKFTFRVQIQSMEEIQSLLSILKYHFVAFQTVIREKFIYDNHVNIYLNNIPGVIEFVEFKSQSKEKLKEAYEILGYSEKEIKEMEEVVKESDDFFGFKTDLNSSIEFEKVDKIFLYTKKNKEVMKKLIEKQKKLYQSILELFGRKVKIYSKNIFTVYK